MFEKFKNRLWLIGILVLGLFIWQSFSANMKLREYKSQIIKFKDGEQVFVEKLSKNGDKIAEQEQIILSQEDAISHNLLTIENLKKVKSEVKIRTITQIDSVYVPIIDTVERLVYDTTGLALLKLPTKFGLENEWYSLYSTINTDGMLIDSLSLFNRQVITIGLESNGILKAPTPKVIVTNENPYVSVNSLSNVIIKNDLKWYEKKAVWGGIGFVGGLTTFILITK